MLIDRMKEIINGGINIAILVSLLLVAICLVPLLFIWCVNSISLAGGSDFYIAHSLWNYFVSAIFLALIALVSR